MPKKGSSRHKTEGWIKGSEYIIYGLIDPRTDKCRYVGLSASGLRRPRRHVKLAEYGEKSYKANWIRQLISKRLYYGIRVLEILSSSAGLRAAEIKWIAFGRAKSWPLTNLTDGGDGLLGASEETRRKIGAQSSARMKDPAYRERIIGARRGKPLPPEWRANLSRAGKARKVFPEGSRRALIESNKRRKVRGPLTPEWKKKISDKMLGRQVTWGDKIGASIRKYFRAERAFLAALDL